MREVPGQPQEEFTFILSEMASFRRAVMRKVPRCELTQTSCLFFRLSVARIIYRIQMLLCPNCSSFPLREPLGMCYPVLDRIYQKLISLWNRKLIPAWDLDPWSRQLFFCLICLELELTLMKCSFHIYLTESVARKTNCRILDISLWILLVFS